jgi:hypothetical protein
MMIVVVVTMMMMMMILMEYMYCVFLQTSIYAHTLVCWSNICKVFRNLDSCHNILLTFHVVRNHKICQPPEILV